MSISLKATKQLQAQFSKLHVTYNKCASGNVACASASGRAV
jgi:hypothetical protein